MKISSLRRLMPASSVEDRKDFAGCFNATLDALGVAPGEDFLLAHPSTMDERVPRAGRCVYCDGAIDPERDYRSETGWAKKRVAGGTNALALREAHDERWACTTCIDRLKRGIDPAQASLA